MKSTTPGLPLSRGLLGVIEGYIGLIRGLGSLGLRAPGFGDSGLRLRVDGV